MKFKIITNNKKVFHFYKETDDVVYLKDTLKEANLTKVLAEVYKYVLKGHKLLSDPIIYNLENIENPFKSILISKDIDRSGINSLKMVKGALKISEKLPQPDLEKNSKDRLEEYRYVDLNLLRNSIKELSTKNK
ncbi:MAG: GrdX family protein [Fusobacterium sp. JB021]|nr:GrdX family protein [Fusobacterium sp. JB020]MDP0494345.1 GrdX family protein [Fusobacterium sp. JB021]MDP0506696.1 GrdX family protein [Fusobacterium sp. JB019]